MTTTFEVLFGSDTDLHSAAAEFYDTLLSLEVEENADLPGAFQLTLPVTTQGGMGAEDLSMVGDDRFRPYGRVAVVVRVDGAPDACIFDGYVLSHTVHLEQGITGSTVQVWGQDTSCLMNVLERTKERPGTDVATANSIFRDYNFTPSDAHQPDDGPDHQLDTHVIMQRGTDAEFLRERARRAGRLFRVCCTERPGEQRGYFIKPDLERKPEVTLSLDPVDTANVEALEFTWDVQRPTKVQAAALVRSKDAVDGAAHESGLALLDQRSLASFAGEHASETRLTATVDGAGELRGRAEALLRDAAWFVRCEGEADLATLPVVLRVGMIVEISGAGNLHSGNYFVWNVRHTISAQSHRMRFVLVRNAIGSP